MEEESEVEGRRRGPLSEGMDSQEVGGSHGSSSFRFSSRDFVKSESTAISLSSLFTYRVD